MRQHALNKLEYNRVIDLLRGYAVTYLGLRHIERLHPLQDKRVIVNKLAEVREACGLLAKGGHPPLPSLEGMEALMGLLGTGYVMSEQEFGFMAQFARSCEQLRQYMVSKKGEASVVSAYGASMHDLKPLREAIEACVDRGRIVDTASSELHKLRKKIRAAEEKLQKRLEGMLSRYSDILQERLVSQRGGRYVLPVKKEYRKRLPGTVLDESSSGQTVFVEPTEAAGLQMELSELRVEENREESRILAHLTGEAEAYASELSVNLEAVGHYDFLFAKAKWGLAIGGNAPELNDAGIIDLREARHPLLRSNPVPLDIRLGDGFRALLITGPNTGGKTVALKTVGLLTLMAQSGLLIPAAQGSRVCVFRTVEVDIGDDQSMDSSLSTFSSHLRNVIDILAHSGGSTLVLLDELATGTDPGEGVGLSIAVLEELYRRGAVLMATTHFNEIKEYARVTEGFRNARMAFDENTLSPLYRLDMGEAGNSYAFVIAAKLGIGTAIIDRARTIADTLKQGGGQARVPQLSEAEKKHSRPSGRDQRYVDRKAKRPANPEEVQPKLWAIGDVVFIPHLRKPGVVYRLPDERGNLIVQVQKEKITVNHKRIRKFIDKKHLYPGEDYDLDIVFETVENRKKRHLMGKRHVEGVTIEKPREQ
ncbi:DNA mismatch repair protein MutS [Cohnella endophytica]|uniref:DNA mismatch repair protein MutS n=1 Tax=Cohnella endophytica TaxID=2419778 RepID=A0A494XZ09_9BACL|nr:DNA mismatch repair protein MutS [Cohnella endophytica]RKP55189.1 DNA mismatch repair protein MutS [Cohnella endophytica]